jgi:hypothetical protein
MIQVILPVAELNDTKRIINGFVSEIPNIVKGAAEKAKDLIIDRVEGQGLAANGSPLMTQSNNPIGAYGQRQGKYRQELGLQVQQVNLRVTGEMWDSFTTETQGNETAVGFDTAESRMKAENLQDFIYETDIFVVSEQQNEIEEIDDLVWSKIDEYFKDL